MDDNTYDWPKLVRILGGVTDVGTQLGKHPSVLSNHAKRGYPLDCKLELMALAKSRNLPVVKTAITVTIGRRKFAVVIEPLP